MVSSENDAALIVGSREDPALFAALFDRHFEPIFSYAARRVGRQLAEDLASEVFLQAFKARSRYDDAEPNARPWLYGIATRLLSRYYRDERRRLLAYARAVSEEATIDATDEVDARTDAAAAVPRVAEALAALHEGDRDALLLFAWGELSYEEIGRALEIPTGTVRSRIHRARHIVRELVGPSGQYRDEDNGVPRPKKGSSGG